jgi:hypothetical protein
LRLGGDGAYTTPFCFLQNYVSFED